MSTPGSFATIRWETEGPVGWLTLNRPAKLNAISKPMVAELNRAMDEALGDDSVRVIVVKGEGRAFSAGFDLNRIVLPTARPRRRPRRSDRNCAMIST